MLPLVGNPLEHAVMVIHCFHVLSGVEAELSFGNGRYFDPVQFLTSPASSQMKYVQPGNDDARESDTALTVCASVKNNNAFVVLAKLSDEDFGSCKTVANPWCSSTKASNSWSTSDENIETAEQRSISIPYVCVSSHEQCMDETLGKNESFYRE
ncbi:hypothetical protein CRG98_024278 [Punica granatum]|uniref:Uncharacterized protein n=1 Tax=Punica granatum TaxID=22663 RepID=A0A2I0JG92_PUNGR|nr:hypothetical protein CRG98_024278 [Punica granatum]